MEEAKLNELCNEHGLRNYDFFVRFFMQRFPDERCGSYVAEWIERFKSGDPRGYMDKKTLGVYINLLLKDYIEFMERC